MAITIPIISEFSDKGITAAQAGFNNFKTKIAEADGAMGKMKAGFGAATDFMKANAKNFAMAAGTAITGFVIKAVGDFQELALAVDRFSNATGLSAIEASRYIEVAGDLGVEVASVEGSINKLNRAIATNNKAFKELGAEIVRTDQNTIDVNKTFINVVDALRKVQDPATRAQLATQLLGKSWAEVSEMIEMGAGGLSAALNEVGEAKLIDENEIAKAKEFRDAQDALREVFEKFSIAVGSEVLPRLTDLLDRITKILDQTSFWGRVTKVVAGAVTRDMKMMAEGFTGKSGAAEAVNETTAEFWRLQEQMYRARFEALKVKQTFDEVKDSYDRLKGSIDDREAWRNLQATIENAGEAAWEAFAKKTPEAIRNSEEALDQARLKLADWVMGLDNIPEDKKTEIIANLDTASLADIERQLAYLTRPRVAGVIVGPGETPSEVRGGRSRMSLGVSSPGTFGITPTSSTGSNVTVNVAGTVVAQDDLVEAVRQGLVNAQRNGSGLVYSNS